MPFISGGGGGGAPAFNGGTITTPLDIAPTDPLLSVLTIEQPAGAVAGGTDWLKVTNEQSRVVCEADSTGFFRLKTREPAQAYWFTPLSLSGGLLQLAGHHGGQFIVTDDGAGVPQITWAGYNAQPASAGIFESEFVFWLDDTPAATKLMVKAKDSGGTVRTAAIALT